MFIAKNKVRIHDIDLSGILYFPRQFRFVNDALEDFIENEGYSFDKIFHKENFVFAIVHCEADYYFPLRVGDQLNVHVLVERIGTTSFIMLYEIYKVDHTHVGSAKTIHVTLDRVDRKKIPVPNSLKKVLEKHLMQQEQ